ncbi:hypothetical protein MRX96_007354 [Rhipicephalus microplus]
MTSQRSNPRAGACSSHHRPSSHSGSFRRRLDEQAATSGPPGLGHAFRDTSCEVIIAKAEREDCPFYEIPPRDLLNPMEVSDNDDRTNISKHSALSEDLEHMLGDSRYEFEALFSVTCARFVMLCHNHLQNVAAPHVDHRCRPPAEYCDPTLAQWRSLSELENDPGQPRCCVHFVPLLSVPDRPTGTRCPATLSSTTPPPTAAPSSATGTWPPNVDGYGRPRSPSMCGRLGVCFTDTFLTFAALRFGVAAFVCGLQLTTYLVLFEVTARTRRTLYCVAATGLCLTLSPVFVYALTELSRSWVATQAIVKLPTTLLGLVVVYVAKESTWCLLAMVDVSRADNATLGRKPSRSAQLSYYSHVMMRARFSGGSAEVFRLKSACAYAQDT